MTRIREFFVNLRKSTKITIISCGCFIALTFIILCFFIMFPITPSDRVLKALGRESVSRQETVTDAATTSPESDSSGNTTTSIITTRNSSHTDFEIVITTGVGFVVTGDKIPTGPSYVVTTNDQPVVPPKPTEPTDPTDPTDPTEPTDPTDPIEPTDPTDPTDPTESPVPPEIPTEPPVVTPPDDPPQPANGDGNGDSW